MENSKKESEFLRSESSTEEQFLQQVKEYQHHLQCMEQLFSNLQNKEENEELFKNSYTSLDDFNKSVSKKHMLTNSLPDIQLLMQEFENKINSKNDFTENNITIPQNKLPIFVQAEPINKDELASPLTFHIQVPTSIIDLLKRKISSDQLSNLSSQCSTKKLFRSKSKIQLFSLLRRLFKKKKNNVSCMVTCNRISQNLELLHLFKQKHQEFISNYSQNLSSNDLNYKSPTKDHHIAERNIVSENSSGTEIDSKLSNSIEKPTLVFPITYNFDEKSHTVAPNLTIQHQISPKKNINPYIHSIKITNDMPVQCSMDTPDKIEKQKINEENKAEITNTEVQSVQVLCECLIKALVNTTEKVNSLEIIKALVENLSENELKYKKSIRDNKSTKIKKCEELTDVNNRLKKIVIENKLKESKSMRKNFQKIPKRRSSKLSVCSLSGNATSDEEFYERPVNIKAKRIQRHARCHSPSMLNYLVCQSERDIDQKVNSNHIKT